MPREAHTRRCSPLSLFADCRHRLRRACGRFPAQAEPCSRNRRRLSRRLRERCAPSPRLWTRPRLRTRDQEAHWNRIARSSCAQRIRLSHPRSLRVPRHRLVRTARLGTALPQAQDDVHRVRKETACRRVLRTRRPALRLFRNLPRLSACSQAKSLSSSAARPGNTPSGGRTPGRVREPFRPR